jgi:hypothetical protein
MRYFHPAIACALALASMQCASAQAPARLEAEFRGLIEKYLEADACDKRFGGYATIKNRILGNAKMFARTFPDAWVEDIWTKMRIERIRHPPLPPMSDTCMTLRPHVVRPYAAE